MVAAGERNLRPWIKGGLSCKLWGGAGGAQESARVLCSLERHNSPRCCGAEVLPVLRGDPSPGLMEPSPAMLGCQAAPTQLPRVGDLCQLGAWAACAVAFIKVMFQLGSCGCQLPVWVSNESLQREMGPNGVSHF